MQPFFDRPESGSAPHETLQAQRFNDAACGTSRAPAVATRA